MALGTSEPSETIGYKIYTITPPGVFFPQYEFVYGYVLASRIMRRKSTNRFPPHGIIFLSPTSGLAEAGRS